MKHAIDPELKYCPRCEDEYRAEIETCAACGVKLVPGAQIVARQKQQARPVSGPIRPDEELVDIRKAPIMEIKQLEAKLAQMGIASLMVREQAGSCGKGCCGTTDVVLRVRKAEADEVMQLLTHDYRRSTGLDEHDLRHVAAFFQADAEQTTCPACGFSFAATSTTCPDCGLCFA